MTLQRMRFLLGTVCVGAMLGSIVVLAVGTLLPYQEPSLELDSTTRRLPRAAETETSVEAISSAGFQSVWHRGLRGALFDEAEVEPEPEPEKIQPVIGLTRLQAKLVGTMVEAEQPFALISTPTEGLQVLTVDRRIGNPETGPKIVRIAKGEVTVVWNGREETLRFPEKAIQ